MTNEEGFLRAIAADPEDTHRLLVFTDWLAEHGQEERAEFIRTQISLANRKDGIRNRPWTRQIEQELTDRQNQLLGTHRAAW